MQKQKHLRTVTLLLLALCLLVPASCAKPPVSDSEQTTAPTDTVSPTDETTAEPSGTEEDTGEDTEPSGTSSSEPEPDEGSGVIKKITGASDEVGIYSIMIVLSDKAADRGVVEMVYYGPKGTPQEDSVVNTFRIEYEKEEAGTFEVRTFFDGEVYQNYHHQSEVKVTNTFGAAVRARNIIITYTPEGEEAQEIYRAEAEQFFVPTT